MAFLPQLFTLNCLTCLHVGCIYDSGCFLLEIPYCVDWNFFRTVFGVDWKILVELYLRVDKRKFCTYMRREVNYNIISKYMDLSHRLSLLLKTNFLLKTNLLCVVFYRNVCFTSHKMQTLFDVSTCKSLKATFKKTKEISECMIEF